MAFTRARVAVYVDGCFWHSCPQHGTTPATNREWWEQKLEKNRLRDAATDAALGEAGWIVIRVWEHEEPAAAADRVQAAVLARRP